MPNLLFLWRFMGLVYLNHRKRLPVSHPVSQVLHHRCSLPANLPANRQCNQMLFPLYNPADSRQCNHQGSRRYTNHAHSLLPCRPVGPHNNQPCSLLGNPLRCRRYSHLHFRLRSPSDQPTLQPSSLPYSSLCCTDRLLLLECHIGATI